jgi:demethylmenaquinone methyltransferase/2-methoxy-6-polyprenyl-1,4-benzoquinol methylase
MTGERFAFGCRTVGPAEKKALVGAAFDSVARTYDRANTLFSFGIDGFWRREGIRRLGLEPDQRVLDVCGGTGALARLAAAPTAPDGLAVVLDLNMAMLAAGREKDAAAKRKSKTGPIRVSGRAAPTHGESGTAPFSDQDRGPSAFSAERPGGGAVEWVRGDAEAIPFPTGSFDAVTLGFGLRNIVRLDRAFAEIARILKPGGRFMAVEFGRPPNRIVGRLYDFYAFRVMPPAAGILFGNGRPYRYLAESVRVFQPPGRTLEMLEEAGFARTRFRRLTAGLAVLFLADKIEEPRVRL